MLPVAVPAGAAGPRRSAVPHARLTARSARAGRRRQASCMRWPQSFSVVRDAGKAFSKDQASVHAAALAFYTGFSLTPVLVVTVTVAGWVLGRAEVQEKLVGQFGSLMGDKG